MPKYVAALIVVEDMARARGFYEGLLGQAVEYDFGENVSFAGGFSLHLRSHYEGLLGGGRQTVSGRLHDFELYFEAVELEDLEARLMAAGVDFVHGLVAQPWQQRCLRVYDPDGHVVEVGEPMDAVVWRLLGEGLAPAEVSRRCSMPLEFVEAVIREREAAAGG